MRTRGTLIPLALSACLLAPSLAFAATPSHEYRQTRPGTGVFTGAGNLWGGSTRPAGAPPGGTPGSSVGQQAHEQGVKDQHAPGQPPQLKPHHQNG